MTKSIGEWICSTKNGDVICEGEGSKESRFFLATIDRILSYGGLLRCVNKRTASEFCKEWNGKLPDMEGKDLFRIYPCKAVFSMQANNGIFNPQKNRGRNKLSR